MKKAGRYVTAMIAAVMTLNLAGFTAAEEVLTEETAMESPMEEITVEQPIQEVTTPAPEQQVQEEVVEDENEVQNAPSDVNYDAEGEKTEDSTEEIEEKKEVEEINEEAVESIEEALDPNRNVEIQLNWGDEEAAVGSTAHFTAVLHGYENVEYSLQWQHSTDSENWENVENATDATYSVVATKENCHDTWRVKVVITGTEA